MKKLLAALMVIFCIGASSVFAKNPYGLSDESMTFLNEYNIDYNIFSEIFNGKEDIEALEKLENSILSVKSQAQAYGFNEIQVKALINNDIKSILSYRKVEFVTIPKCKVTFNGQTVDSSARQYPLLQFRDITYFPMTYDDCRFLGLTTQWDDAQKKLTIEKQAVENAKYNDYGNYQNRETYVYKNIDGIAGDVENCKFKIMVNGKETVNADEKYPLLIFRNITYFPLTWRFAVDEFGWEYNYDEENGLVINSGKEKPTEENNGQFRIIGYYSGDLFDEPLDALQTDKLTHIMYAFLIPQKDGTCMPFQNADKVKALVEKAHNDGCKVYAAVGGWSYNDVPLSQTFEEISADDALRGKFILNIADITEEYGFDGVELDWEYPSELTAKNYEKLVTELCGKLRENKKYVTAALNGAWSETEGPEVSNHVSQAVLDALEFINVMGYDMNNTQHSPFWFANTSIDYWLTRGVPADKIVLGMPLYARPSWMQYRHIVEENPENAYSDYTNINGADCYYNGLPTLCKKTVLAKEKAGGVMLFDVNEDAVGKLSAVTMIDNVVTELSKGGLSESNAELLKRADESSEK